MRLPLFFQKKKMFVEEVELKPNLTKSVPTSFIAQIVNIQLRGLYLCKASFSPGFERIGRTFYGDQLNGTNFDYAPNYQAMDGYYVNFLNSKNGNSNFYSFKLISDFDEKAKIYGRFIFSPTQCPAKIPDNFNTAIEDNDNKETPLLRLIIGALFGILSVILLSIQNVSINYLPVAMITGISFIPGSFTNIIYTSFICLILLKEKNTGIVFALALSGFQNDVLSEIIILAIIASLDQRYSFKFIAVCAAAILQNYFIPDVILLLPFVYIVFIKERFGKKINNIYLLLALAFAIAPALITSICNKEEVTNMHSDQFNITIEPFNRFTSYLGKTIDALTEAALKPINFEKCKYCDLKSINKVGSTERDIIIIQIGGEEVYRAKPAIFSLRATGCRAKVIACLKPGEKLPPDYQQELEDCGVYTVNIQSDHTNWLFNYMKIIRFPLLSEFFLKNKGLFDRAFYFDAYDTVFQGDPFFPDWKPNTLYASPENHKFYQNGFVISWLKRIPGLNYSYFMNDINLCTGLFGGDGNTMIILGELTKTMYKGTDFITEDQGIYNTLIYSNVLKRNGIDVVPIQDYASIGYTYGDWIKCTKIGDIHSEGRQVTPTVIHQYNRHRPMEEMIYEKCHLHLPSNK